MKGYRGGLFTAVAVISVMVTGFVMEPMSAYAGDDPLQTGEKSESRFLRLELLIMEGEGRNAQIVGDSLLLLEGNRKVIAPDGTFRLPDGRTLKVSGGRLTGYSAQAGRPEMPPDSLDRDPAVQSGRPGLPAVQSGRPDVPKQAGRPEMPVKADEVSVPCPGWPARGARPGKRC